MSLDTVILVHGFAATPFAMTPLARRLKKCGFEVVNWGYPSLRGDFRGYVRDLARELERLDGETGDGKIHVIGHSMGAIIAREALVEYCPKRVGRLVLMAPPLRGSRMADRLKSLLTRFAPLALEMTYVENFQGLKPLPAKVEVGVVAARFDHLVDLEDTRIGHHKEHVVVNWSHTLTTSPSAIRAASRFIQFGSFGKRDI